MVTENVIQKETKVAAAVINARRVVIMDTDGKVTEPTSIVDLPFGINERAVNTDDSASIMPIANGGKAIVQAGKVLNENDQVSTDGDGKAIAAASGSYTFGICVKAGNTDDLVEIQLSNIAIKA